MYTEYFQLERLSTYELTKVSPSKKAIITWALQNDSHYVDQCVINYY